MAGFNPQGDIQTPQDELFRSRPLQPDRSFADLFGDATKAVAGVGDYLYKSAQQDIWNQASSTVDKIVESQPDVRKALDNAGNVDLNGSPGAQGSTGANGPQDLSTVLASNPTLADSYSNLSKVTTAANQGVMSRSMYWAQMNIAAKELRSKYPGWNEEISTMFNNLTGYHTLEGHLDNAAYTEDTRGQKASELSQLHKQEYTKYYPMLANNPDGQKIISAVNAGQISIDDPIVTNAIQAQAVLDGHNRSIEYQKTELGFKMEQNKATSADAANLFGREIGGLTQSVLHTANPVGTGGGDILSTLSNLKMDDPNAPKTIAAAGNWAQLQYASLKSQAQAKALEYTQKFGMTTEQATKVIDDQLQPLKTVVDLAGGKDPAMLATYGNLWKATVDQGAYNLTQAVPDLATIAASGKIDPEFSKALSLSATSTVATVAAMLNGKTAAQAKSMLDVGPNADPNQTSRSMGQSFVDITKGISAGTIKGDLATGFMTNNFAKDTTGLDNYFTNLNSSGKQAFFETMTSPQFQKSVMDAAKNSPGLDQKFAAWMTSKFQTLPSVMGMGGAIAQAQKPSNSPSAQVTYNYDPIKGGFTMNIPKTDNGFGMSGIPAISQQKMQSDLNNFNNALGHMAQLYKNMGVDPNDPQRGIPELLKTMNIPGQQEFGPFIEKFSDYHNPPQLQNRVESNEDLTDYRKTLENGGAQGSEGTNGPQGSTGVPIPPVRNYLAMRSAAENAPASQAISKATNDTIDPQADSAAKEFLSARSLHGAQSVEGMQPVLRTRLADMISSAPTGIREGLGILSGYRNPEEGRNLYYQHGIATGDWSGIRVARPGGSLHERGEAADLSYNGRSLSQAPPEVIKWVHDHVSDYHLKLPMSYEPWHVEPEESRDGKIVGSNPSNDGNLAQKTGLNWEDNENGTTGDKRVDIINKYRDMAIQILKNKPSLAEGEKGTPPTWNGDSGDPSLKGFNPLPDEQLQDLQILKELGKRYGHNI